MSRSSLHHYSCSQALNCSKSRAAVVCSHVHWEQIFSPCVTWQTTYDSASKPLCASGSFSSACCNKFGLDWPPQSLRSYQILIKWDYIWHFLSIVLDYIVSLKAHYTHKCFTCKIIKNIWSEVIQAIEEILKKSNIIKIKNVVLGIRPICYLCRILKNTALKAITQLC